MYKNIQETFGILQKALDSSHDFHHSVELCGLLQASLEPSTLFPLMAKCRSLQKLPRPYINPWGDSFETSYDTRPTQAHLAHQARPQSHLGSLRHTWPIRHHLRPIQVHLDPFKHTMPTLAHYEPFGPHLDSFGPFRITLAFFRSPEPLQATQVHLGTFGPSRLTQPTQAHLNPPQAYLGSPISPRSTQVHLSTLKFTQAHLKHTQVTFQAFFA